MWRFIRGWFIDPAVPMHPREISVILAMARRNLRDDPTASTDALARWLPLFFLLASAIVVCTAINFAASGWIALGLLVLGGAMVLRILMLPMPLAWYVRRAARQLGHDVCAACGYWLRSLEPDARCCPECGARRDPII